MSDLNVNPADLHQAAGDCAELAARAAPISPQAVDQVNRVIATHGPTGYPVAVGIVAGLVSREARVTGKAADFTAYSQRFTVHAATYRGVDAKEARRYDTGRVRPV
ncbi:MAG TPA: type VII secretion target [Mycobacterium sp.]|nr:type VII secretion target [Mycobacterium sp.]